MKRKIICFAVMLLLCFQTIGYCAEDTLYFYVSNTGNDYHNGTVLSPYKTLYRAREAIRYLKMSGMFPANGVHIVLREGTYLMLDSLYFDSRDSGTESGNVVYEAYQNEKVILSGGVNIPVSSAQAVTDSNITGRLQPGVKDQIKCIDLSGYVSALDPVSECNDMSIDHSDYLVSIDNTLITNAKWPNEGYYKPQKIYSSGNESGEGFVIGYEDDRISSWQNPTEICLEGYGKYLWRYQKIKLSAIDTQQKKIYSGGTRLFSGIYDEANIYFSNVLEELDAPGEWYLDRTNKKLYYYPVSDNDTSIQIAISKKPLIYSANLKNTQFKNIQLENTRADGVCIIGSENVVFDGCNFQNIGNRGLIISNGKVCGIRNSVMTYIGCGGVKVDGGNLYDLTYSSNFVLNNDFCKFSQVVPTYSPAVWASGIGDNISYNTIHESFHAGIIFSGNENIISHNEIYNVLKGTEDAGAIYAYSVGSSRRNVIENNYIHHLGMGYETYAATGLYAVYFDGFNSGQIVRNNLFYDLPSGVHINGGGFHRIVNNIFTEVSVPVFSHSYTTLPSTDFWNGILKLYRNENIWNSRYPELAQIPDPSVPAYTYAGNVISNNIFHKDSGKGGMISTSGAALTDNYTTSENIFADASSFNFHLTQTISTFTEFDWADVGVSQILK